MSAESVNADTILPSVITVSGNWMNLSPPITNILDYPGAAASIQICQSANVIDNMLVAGGHRLLAWD